MSYSRLASNDAYRGGHPLVRNKQLRDAALACAHALEGSQLELTNALAYADKAGTATACEAIDEALLCVLRAREMLRITLRRIPE